jgi:hypothetical protein
MRSLSVLAISTVASTVSCLPRNSRPRPSTRYFANGPDSSASPLGETGQGELGGRPGGQQAGFGHQTCQTCRSGRGGSRRGERGPTGRAAAAGGPRSGHHLLPARGAPARAAPPAHERGEDGLHDVFLAAAGKHQAQRQRREAGDLAGAKAGVGGGIGVRVQGAAGCMFLLRPSITQPAAEAGPKRPSPPWSSRCRAPAAPAAPPPPRAACPHTRGPGPAPRPRARRRRRSTHSRRSGQRLGGCGRRGCAFRVRVRVRGPRQTGGWGKAQGGLATSAGRRHLAAGRRPPPKAPRSAAPAAPARTRVVLVLHAAVDDADGHQRARHHKLVGGVEVPVWGGGGGQGGVRVRGLVDGQGVCASEWAPAAAAAVSAASPPPAAASDSCAAR